MVRLRPPERHQAHGSLSCCRRLLPLRRVRPARSCDAWRPALGTSPSAASTFWRWRNGSPSKRHTVCGSPGRMMALANLLHHPGNRQHPDRRHRLQAIQQGSGSRPGAGPPDDAAGPPRSHRRVRCLGRQHVERSAGKVLGPGCTVGGHRGHRAARLAGKLDRPGSGAAYCQPWLLASLDRSMDAVRATGAHVVVEVLEKLEGGAR